MWLVLIAMAANAIVLVALGHILPRVDDALYAVNLMSLAPTGGFLALYRYAQHIRDRLLLALAGLIGLLVAGVIYEPGMRVGGEWLFLVSLPVYGAVVVIALLERRRMPQRDVLPFQGGLTASLLVILFGCVVCTFAALEGFRSHTDRMGDLPGDELTAIQVGLMSLTSTAVGKYMLCSLMLWMAFVMTGLLQKRLYPWMVLLSAPVGLTVCGSMYLLAAYVGEQAPELNGNHRWIRAVAGHIVLGTAVFVAWLVCAHVWVGPWQIYDSALYWSLLVVPMSETDASLLQRLHPWNTLFIIDWRIVLVLLVGMLTAVIVMLPASMRAVRCVGGDSPALAAPDAFRDVMPRLSQWLTVAMRREGLTLRFCVVLVICCMALQVLMVAFWSGSRTVLTALSAWPALLLVHLWLTRRMGFTPRQTVWIVSVVCLLQLIDTAIMVRISGVYLLFGNGPSVAQFAWSGTSTALWQVLIRILAVCVLLWTTRVRGMVTAMALLHAGNPLLAVIRGVYLGCLVLSGEQAPIWLLTLALDLLVTLPVLLAVTAVCSAAGLAAMDRCVMWLKGSIAHPAAEGVGVVSTGGSRRWMTVAGDVLVLLVFLSWNYLPNQRQCVEADRVNQAVEADRGPIVDAVARSLLTSLRESATLPRRSEQDLEWAAIKRQVSVAVPRCRRFLLHTLMWLQHAPDPRLRTIEQVASVQCSAPLMNSPILALRRRGSHEWTTELPSGWAAVPESAMFRFVRVKEQPPLTGGPGR